MKILFFSDHFKPEPSAPAAHVYERAKLWVKWGHKVTVITNFPNFPDGAVYTGYKNSWRIVEKMEGIRVVRVKTFIVPNKGFFLRILDYISYMISACFFAIFEKKPNVVISTSPHLFVPVAGVIYSMLRRVPHVFEIRDLWPASIISTGAMKDSSIYKLLESLELMLYRKSCKIITLTDSFTKDLISRDIPPDKINTVINGANLDLFRPRDKNTEIEARYGLKSKFVVGYLGTIGLASGLENIVLAAKLLKEEPIVFFLVGAGALKDKLIRLTSELELHNIIFTGRQLKEDMPRFWSVCDVSLIHLRNDKVFSTVIPSKIFESMAMGLPIIYVGPIGEGTAIVDFHRCGLVVQPDNPKALADAVRSFVTSGGKYDIFSKNSLAAAPIYSRERQASDCLKVLKMCLNSGCKT